MGVEVFHLLLLTNVVLHSLYLLIHFSGSLLNHIERCFGVLFLPNHSSPTLPQIEEPMSDCIRVGSLIQYTFKFSQTVNI